MTVFDVITLLGGLAFFLFGMSVMGGGLKGLAGKKMESFLGKLSSNPVKGLFLGIFVTAIIQSSSAATVMVVGFVNAGMMKVAQSITLILGSQIGTTVTGWLLTLAGTEGSSGIARIFSSATFVPVFSLAGIILYMFIKKRGMKHFGSILLGFGLLMTGMSTMSGAVTPLREDPEFLKILTLFSHPLPALLMGVLLAAVIQSSSAGVGIVQAISAAGVLSLDACLPLIMGINIGCSSPVLLSMMGSSKNGKRSAVIYVCSSVLGVCLVCLFYYPLRAFGALDFMDQAAGPVSIALLNTTTRAFSVFLMMFLRGLLEKAAYLLVKYDPAEDADSEYLEKLTESALRYPSTALNLSLAAALKMAEIARDTVIDAVGLITDYDKAVIERVSAREALLDKYEDKLGDYLMRLLAAGTLTANEGSAEKVLSSISDLERMGDHAQNIAELATEMQEKKQFFSPEAREELKLVSKAINQVTDLATKAYCDSDIAMALQVEPLEEVIDIVCDELKLRHVSRLQSGRCTINVGFVFNDLITNFERIADHCSNIAIYTLKADNPSYMPHEYSSNAEASVQFTEAFLRFTEEYVSYL
jgi:phosphate:Na+ symporter